jgi:hypothetical protein
MFDFKNNFKDAFTNLVALVIVIGTAIQVYLSSTAEINWFSLLVAIGSAIVAWFTGKPNNP